MFEELYKCVKVNILQWTVPGWLIKVFIKWIPLWT